MLRKDPRAKRTLPRPRRLVVESLETRAVFSVSELGAATSQIAQLFAATAPAFSAIQVNLRDYTAIPTVESPPVSTPPPGNQLPNEPGEDKPNLPPPQGEPGSGNQPGTGTPTDPIGNNPGSGNGNTNPGNGSSGNSNNTPDTGSTTLPALGDGLGWKYANTSFWTSLTEITDTTVEQKGEIRREEATFSQRNASSVVERVPTDSSELTLDADATEQRGNEVEVIDVIDASGLTKDDAESTSKSLNTDANNANTHEGEVHSDNQARGTSPRVDAPFRRSMVSKRVGSPTISAAERRDREGGLIALVSQPGDANGFTLSVGPVLAHALGESSTSDNVMFVAVPPPSPESDTASEPASSMRINFATLTTVLVGGMLVVAARRYSQPSKPESEQELVAEQRPLDQQ